MLTISIKSYNDLTTEELYKVLQLRSEVFVVEQNCVYQDLDGKDQKAIHALGFKHQQLVAYARIFKPGDYFKEAAIGRVVVKQNERHRNYGQDIVKASIQVVEIKFKTKKIRISAQTYLSEFYSTLGFNEVGEQYLEDGIPHINMLKI